MRTNIFFRFKVIMILSIAYCFGTVGYGQQKAIHGKQVASAYQEAKNNFKQINRYEQNLISKVPQWIGGKLAEGVNLQDRLQLKQFLKKSNKIFRMDEKDGNFEVKSIFVDKLKMAHAKTQQTHRGVPVWGSELLVHSDASGTITAMNGRVTPDLIMDISPTISADAALQIAQKDLGVSTYRWLNPEQEKAIKEVFKDQSRSWRPKPELCIAPRNGDFDNGEYMLAWKMMIPVDGDKRGNYEYFVDSKSGEIIHKFNSMKRDVGTGLTNYYGTVQFNTKHVSPVYELYDVQRAIKTYTADEGFAYPGQLLTDSDNYWDQNRDAVDVHWGVMMADSLYSHVFSRNGFGGNRSEIRSIVQWGFSMNNAGWDGVCLIFGSGDDINFTSWTSLDICGHEYTHAVTEQTSDLIYYGESGALNESFSDIFGAVIEYFTYGLGDDRWWCSEKVYKPTAPWKGLRYMADPKTSLAETPQPDTYHGDLWYYGGDDYAGVHTNGGPMNYAFYLLSEGGGGTNDNGRAYSVYGQGIERAREIAYRALTVYMTASSNYLACRNAFIMAAADLYGSVPYDVKEIFNAIGVYSQSVPVSLLEAIYVESGSGGYYRVNGTNVGSSWSGSLPSDQQVTIEAVPPAGYIVSHWSDGSNSNPILTLPADPISVTYKMVLGSTVSIPTASNGQRRFVTTAHGTEQGLVYESGNKIWFAGYNSGADTWTNEFLLSDGLGSSGPTNNTPSICSIQDSVFVVWEKKWSATNYEIGWTKNINGHWQDGGRLYFDDPMEYRPMPVVSTIYSPYYNRNLLLIVYRLNANGLIAFARDDAPPWYENVGKSNIPYSGQPHPEIIDFCVSQPTTGEDRPTICYSAENKLYSLDVSLYSSMEFHDYVVVPASDNIPLSSSYGLYHGTLSLTNSQVVCYGGKTFYSWIEVQSYANRDVAFVCYQERNADGTWNNVRAFDMYALAGNTNPSEVTSLTMSRVTDCNILSWNIGSNIYEARISGTGQKIFYTGLQGYASQLLVSGGMTEPQQTRFIYSTNNTTPSHMALGPVINPAQQTVIPLSVGWNLVSVPRVQTNYEASVVFPDLYGSMFEYSPLGGYKPAPILELGKGYWVFYISLKTVTIDGAPPPIVTTNGKLGWNLVGGLATPVNLSNIQLSGGNIILGDIGYGYLPGSGYQNTTVINPGQGVWIYVSGPAADFTITLLE